MNRPAPIDLKKRGKVNSIVPKTRRTDTPHMAQKAWTSDKILEEEILRVDVKQFEVLCQCYGQAAIWRHSLWGGLFKGCCHIREEE